MNKLKLWKIESLVEEGFGGIEPKNPVLLGLDFSALEKIKQNYKNGISKFNKDFYLVEKLSFEKSLEPVFFGEDRELETPRQDLGVLEFFGLEKQQLIFKNKKPIYLVDNHNKALFSFLEISENFGEKLNIVHIDAHRDDAKFLGKYPQNISWENISGLLKETMVSDYLDLAQNSNLIGEVLNITQSQEFKEFEISKEKYILSLDIDIFGPEGEAVDLELKIKTICKAWSGAVAVVVATSPGYIEQKDAQEIIEIFVKYFKD